MMDIVYRDVKPDPVQYLEVFETAGWNIAYKMDLGEFVSALDQSWYIICAYHEDELVGIGRVVSDGVLYGMIYDMIVKPSHQGKGIGSEILKRLVDKCLTTGLRDVQLFSAKGKQSFYGRRGFVKRPADAPGMYLRRDKFENQ